jgi:hypothetical protein
MPATSLSGKARSKAAFFFAGSHVYVFSMGLHRQVI